MPKTITLTRPNGLKFEVNINEVKYVINPTFESRYYILKLFDSPETHGNSIFICETPEEVKLMVEKAKKENEQVTNCNQLEKQKEIWATTKTGKRALFLLDMSNLCKTNYPLLFYIEDGEKGSKVFGYSKTGKSQYDDKFDLIDFPPKPEKTTNLTREEMLKAIDEGKLVKAYINGTLLLFSNASLGKDIRWEIVEEKEE